MTTVVIISFVTISPPLCLCLHSVLKTKFPDVFPLRHTILAAATVPSLHNKHNFIRSNVITMDLAETKDWKEVVKEDSALNDKSGVDK